MKRVFSMVMMASVLTVFGVMDWALADQTEALEDGQGTGQLLDLAVVVIQSPEARAFFRSDTIRVRKTPSAYMPKGTLALLALDKPTEEECRDRLAGVLSAHGMKKLGRMEKLGGALGIELEGASCWLHPASGGYKFTVTDSVMSKPTRLKNFKEAVQIGLDYIAKNQLIELGQDEEIDIVSVSAVHNALTEVKSPDLPIEQFVSDYYVSFGRRFRGIPVIGSQLTIRLDGDGDVAMEKMTWRHIRLVEEGKVRITETPLQELVFNSPQFQELWGSQEMSPEDIHITEFQAGYMEAPVSWVQEWLRPGCLVCFWVGKNKDEQASQILLSLEEQGSRELLWGEDQ
jgi:hypothetical protein